ncbi:MAG: P1 family peptidase [Clostridiales bacterium]|nr:P1 family peptidase [Clostridiales bacterium]
MNLVREIPIAQMDGFRIGNAQNEEAGTGVTAILFEQGARVGVDVSGGGPASRETPLASSLTADNPVNAIVLSGGSAYGLAASDGVMRWLEERGIGYDTGYARVPLVCQSCIYDLGYRRADVRPDVAMGYTACEDSLRNQPFSGSVGAGTGATVGKLCGMERATKAGLGLFAAELGELRMAAVVAVNALGDIYDPADGRKVAGLRTADGTGFADSREQLYQTCVPRDLFTGNTTIGVVITNAEFSKGEMGKIASMTRNAYARCIRPVGTMADGDTIYAASVGGVKADINVVGALAADVMARAILRAVGR